MTSQATQLVRDSFAGFLHRVCGGGDDGQACGHGEFELHPLHDGDGLLRDLADLDATLVELDGTTEGTVAVIEHEPSQPILVARGIHKSLGGHEVLKGVSLQVDFA